MAIDLHAFFEANNDEYLKYENISNMRCTRPDLNAFLLLNELIPGSDDIIVAAEHDRIYLSIDPKQLAEVATEDQLIELIRCGLCYYESDEGFTMLV